MTMDPINGRETISTTILILPQSKDCVGLMSFTNSLCWSCLVAQLGGPDRKFS
ncbi:hypothetical protein NC653_018138 [Populus alba x Populus x berolinensis]|uniref:Uncharacterized protein n=1 Tax=Populus alba x Populus x berolinensis TaxID=444605 RepID=A0AAD6QS50_9ROSI|nr:hypothetical protein NC653_018138 [Populus alba x Populus x berolinensis]